MPHIKKDEQVQLYGTDVQATREGHLCYLFSMWALDTYKEEPRWSTIHKIRVALRNPFHTEGTHAIIRRQMGAWQKSDIETAADLAFVEFYRRVGALYEDGMIQQNGDVFADAPIPSMLEVNNAKTTTEAAKEPVSALQGTEVPSVRGAGHKGK